MFKSILLLLTLLIVSCTSSDDKIKVLSQSEFENRVAQIEKNKKKYKTQNNALFSEHANTKKDLDNKTKKLNSSDTYFGSCKVTYSNELISNMDVKEKTNLNDQVMYYSCLYITEKSVDLKKDNGDTIKVLASSDEGSVAVIFVYKFTKDVTVINQGKKLARNGKDEVKNVKLVEVLVNKSHVSK